MVRILFIEHDGRAQAVDAEPGQTLMQVGTSHGVSGLVGECGGARVCATCHCYIDEAWRQAVGAACEDEKMMLEFSEHYRSNSRLSCQIPVCESMEGVVVRLPPSQP